MLFHGTGLSSGARGFTMGCRQMLASHERSHTLRTHSERVDAALDDALSMTFPASDPIAPFIAHAPLGHTQVETTFGGYHRKDVGGMRRPP